MTTTIKNTKRFFALVAILMLAAVSFIGCKKTDDPVIDSPQEYINYSVNGTPYSFIRPTDSIMSDSGSLTFVLHVKGTRIPAATDSVVLTFDHVAINAGTYQHLMAFRVPQMPNTVKINAPIFVGITECGPTGQYVTGNFSGSYTGPAPTNTLYTITCDFRIKRTF